MDKIIIRGLTEHNLKNLSFEIPKHQIVIFTGVSGSGKSSIVFDTIAAEATRQMNETYPAFVRSRFKKVTRPSVDSIEHLSPVVVVDQSPLGFNARSTVGTVTEIYTGLRLLFSRIGEPSAGPASRYSFNDPTGMCPTCTGMGVVTDIDWDALIDRSKSFEQGAIRDTMFRVGSWYWKKYMASGLFDVHKPLNEFSQDEWHALLDGAGEVDGVKALYRKRYVSRDLTQISDNMREKGESLMRTCRCPECGGQRLCEASRATRINGQNIAELSALSLPVLREFLRDIHDTRVQGVVDALIADLTRLIDIGLPYLSLDRSAATLSGGEAQRIKLVRFLSSSLNEMIYVFDEPSTGLHPRDVFRMNQLLQDLKRRGNTVLVVEHDPDVIAIADTVIDIGPAAGTHGGQITFQGAYADLLKADCPTGCALRMNVPLNTTPRQPRGFLPIRGASRHNLKNLDVDIPLGVICAITGVAGSGKSSLISGVFAETYADRVVPIDQSPITATQRSTPATYLEIFDEIRKLFARENGVSESLFSFNAAGACPDCGGKGVIVTELAFMDPITTECERCHGCRYSDEALSYRYKGKNIDEIQSLTALEACDFFEQPKILKPLRALCEVGLAYMTLGQPLSTLSGGERQRIKLAKSLRHKGEVYIFDEPTTGLHRSDCEKLMALFDRLVDAGNSVLLIEHDLDVIKRADYIIDIGPDAGDRGGELVFAGTPSQMCQSDTWTARFLRASLDANHQATMPNAVRSDTTFDQTLSVHPIGRIAAGEDDFVIEIDPRWRPALHGLETYSHVQIYWWFDGCDNARDRAYTSHASPYTHGPQTVGVFASRSPERPNPIAVTTAQILHIDHESGKLYISYIDARHDTPVLDLKPYIPSLDRVERPQMPNWCAHWPKSLEESADFDWAQEFNFDLS